MQGKRTQGGTRMRGRGHGSVRVFAAACVCAVALGAAGSARGAATSRPTVAPATGGGGKPVVPGFTKFDLAEVGYEQSEFFLSGTASAYQTTPSPANDGKFTATPTTTAPYTT